MPTDSTAVSRWATPLALALLLLLHGWLAISATREKSTAVDEMAHLTAGHAMLARGDYRLQPENGVLPQLWESMPAYLQHRKLPPASAPGWAQPNVWTLGHSYFHRIGNDLGALLHDGRLMNVAWSLATGLLVFFWTRRLFGTPGAWIAVLFWAFSPTFLAHGALATSDVCMTFFMLASVAAYSTHLHRPGPFTLLLSAVVCGLAFVVKYSAVLLPVMFVPLAALWFWSHRAATWRGRALTQKRDRVGFLMVSTAVHVALALGIIWAFHAFRYEPTSDSAYVNDYTRPWAVVLQELQGPIVPLLRWARLHHVLPDSYLYGFAFVLDFSHARGAFLNGATSFTGWVSFFPFAFLYKTTLGLLVALAGVGVIAVRRLQKEDLTQRLNHLRRVSPPLVLFGVYWAFSLTSHLNIGQRHLLPTYPVLFISTGAIGWAMMRWHRNWAWFAAAVLALHVTASNSIRPHYLAFFNRIAGGPAEGYRHLVDSSLDWGQDLPGLAEWLRTNHSADRREPVYLAYFGTGEPAYYGIDAIPMVPLLIKVPDRPWYRLEPGLYAVSATLLQQGYSPIRDAWSPKLEKEFQDLHALEPALLDYAAHPERRREWEAAAPSTKWDALWERHEQLQFTRLCYLLRARQPDAQIGYSINVYHLTAADVAAATGPLSAWLKAVEAGHTSAASAPR
jgi:hypothetical protein